MVPQAPRDLPAEGGIVQRHDPRRQRCTLRPDHGGQVGFAIHPGHRQLREGSGGQEMFQRGAIMRARMGDRRHDPALAVSQPRHLDPGFLPQRRGAALGRDHQAAGNGRAAPDLHRGAIGMAPDRGERRRLDRQCFERVHPRVERHAQIARFDHPAKRPLAGIGMVEMQEQRRGRASHPAVRHADIQDWPRFGRQTVPDPSRLQQGARPGGDRISPAIEIRVFHRRERSAVDHRSADPSTGQAAGERGPDRTSAYDAHIDIH